MEFTVEIPALCPNCEGLHFNVWGTGTRETIMIGVSCVRCGYKLKRAESRG